MNATQITIAGNCADAPQVRFTKEGKATARLRVAVPERQRDEKGEWADGPFSWHTVIAWGTLAEHAAESIAKGDRVIVHGRLAQRDYQTDAGERRTVWEVTADEIGLSLRPRRGNQQPTWCTGQPMTGDRAPNPDEFPAGNGSCMSQDQTTFGEPLRGPDDPW